MNIAACTEILAIAPDQHHSHIRATMAFHDPLTERLQELRTHPVRRIGTVQRQMRNSLRDLEQDHIFSHAKPPSDQERHGIDRPVVVDEADLLARDLETAATASQAVFVA